MWDSEYSVIKSDIIKSFDCIDNYALKIFVYINLCTKKIFTKPELNTNPRTQKEQQLRTNNKRAMRRWITHLSLTLLA